MENKLSLIIPYRRRGEHLEIFCKWFSKCNYENIEVIFVESDDKDYSKNVCNLPNVRYVHIEEAPDSRFHLSKYLNIGTRKATGNYVCPYDIDLIPFNSSLDKHFKYAVSTEGHILSGYRLNTTIENWENYDVDNMNLCQEDSSSALKKHLTTHEKFGVCPMFKKDIIELLGGWDESFIGWGGEDQDMIERYLDYTKMLFLRSPQLVYLHIEHGYESHWKSENLVDSNRNYYYDKRRSSSDH